MPEYGRNVQKMVDFALTLTDRAERQQCAETIIKVMGNMIPHQKDAEDLERTLWDHLALISDYKLDVDSPYPINIITTTEREHPHLDYPQQRITYRHYGTTLESMIRTLPDIPDEEARHQTLELVVNQMAKSLATWNKNVLSPEKLACDLEELTDGRIQLSMSPRQLDHIISSALALTKPVSGKKKKK